MVNRFLKHFHAYFPKLIVNTTKHRRLMNKDTFSKREFVFVHLKEKNSGSNLSNFQEPTLILVVNAKRSLSQEGWGKG